MDALIRENKITAVMASSLMNDLGFARNVVWHLADAGKALYGAKNAELKEAEELMALSEGDVDDMNLEDAS